MNNGNLRRPERYKRYSIEEVHAKFQEWINKGIFKKGPSKRQKYYYDTFDGYPVKTYSQRYVLFMKSTKCANCGLEANCYILEKNPESKAYHFNLYYVSKDGSKEVLFTKDHIIPKSIGGMNTQDNYQTMCSPCNYRKGAKIIIKSCPR